ncbi:MAG TPA: sulfotransferase [Acidimicrobiales bacterium]|nr:sulfotransferase [Acidimicrobiales bacterium]
MGLQIIGAGLGRTGTTSLKLALEDLLGGRCYHMLEVRERPADPDVWGDAYEGRLPDWGAFFEGYAATVDWPAAPFWKEMSEAFPQAPIVLSLRDPDAWWKSVSSTIFIALETYFAPDAPADGWTRMGVGMMTRFTPRWREEGAAKAAYLAYNDHVRATAPPDRLVEWGPEDGWGPICAALGREVPERPFPHVNTTAQARAELGLDDA